MPEWVYWVGWLAVPVALVAASAWWHEREQFNDLQQWFDLLQDEMNDVRTMNGQLRRELNRVEMEHGDLRRKVARTRPHLVGGADGMDPIDVGTFGDLS